MCLFFILNVLVVFGLVYSTCPPGLNSLFFKCPVVNVLMHAEPFVLGKWLEYLVILEYYL